MMTTKVTNRTAQNAADMNRSSEWPRTFMAGSVKCQLGALTEACYRDPEGDRRQYGNGGLNHRIPLISYRGVLFRVDKPLVQCSQKRGILPA